MAGPGVSALSVPSLSASGPPFSLADGPGPWPQYVARPVLIAEGPQHDSLVDGLGGPAAGARQQGGELVLVWMRWPAGRPWNVAV